MKRIIQLSLPAAVLAVFTATAVAQTSYSTGFEDFTVGPIDPAVGPTQGGWSGGTSPDFTNNTAGKEQIVSGVANTGSQSWHYARGYGSPGEGTAYTPNLSATVSNIGDSMSGSLSFKTHTVGDGSSFALETGNLAGTDRSEILAYVENTATGLSIFSYKSGGAIQPIMTLPTSVAGDWHQIDFDLTLTATGNEVSISVDGSSAVVFDGYLDTYRDVNNFAYSESSRLKLRPRHADSGSFNGFYFDDINYSVAAVPEPATVGVVGVAALGLLARRRKTA